MQGRECQAGVDQVQGGGNVINLKIMLIAFTAWLGVICLYSEGKIMGPVGVKSNQKQEWLHDCLSAVAVIAAEKGKLPMRQKVTLTYVKSDEYGLIMVSDFRGLQVKAYARSMRCDEEGMVTSQVICAPGHCVNVHNGKVITIKRASPWVIVVDRQKRGVTQQLTPLTSLKSTTLESNVFYQWLKFSAKLVEKQDCIVCHKRKIPQVLPIPFEGVEKCLVSPGRHCFAHCVLWKAHTLEPYCRRKQPPKGFKRKGKCVEEKLGGCPLRLSDTKQYQIPPVVHVAVNTVFPFCLASGLEHESILWNDTVEMANQLIQCEYHNYLFPRSKQTWSMKVCNTTSRAKMQCARVVSGAGGSGPDVYIVGHNKSYAQWLHVYNLTNGTYPLADVFWMCEEDRRIRSVLVPNWKGICAPVMLTGQIYVIHFADKEENGVLKRIKKDAKAASQFPWEEHADIYVTADRMVKGVPAEHQAIGEAWIVSGQVAGSIPIAGTIVNAQYIAKNSRWINYLWYNQQRFLNWTIAALQGVSEQLHATSLMTLQNRLLIETMLAEEQGVCDRFGDDCCTAIPMHTGEAGNITKVLENLKRIRNDHVKHSNWNSSSYSVWEWFQSLSLLQLLKSIGIAIGIILLILMLLTCCVFPLIKILIAKTLKAVTQFPVRIDQSVDFTVAVESSPREPQQGPDYADMSHYESFDDLLAYIAMGSGCVDENGPVEEPPYGVPSNIPAQGVGCDVFTPSRVTP